jgi:uncharacterized protein
VVESKGAGPGTARSTGGGAPLAARELPALFRRVHAALAARREAIDDLNVFPVPDGDTGTNMTLTVRAGLDALYAARPASPEELAIAVIRGSVRGARGNSGVILSQVLRAVVEVVTGHPHVDAKLFADALSHARDLAYEAVAEPVEGTILTAIAAAADAAHVAVGRGADLVTASATVCAATAAAVERTQDQLRVLSDAGVVDAGARGFEVLLAAVHGHLTGQEAVVREDAPRVITERDGDACHASTSQPFEVQYLLDAPDESAGPLRRRLERLGDSVVVVAAGGLLNVHVHTAAIGPTIEAGLEYGRPSSIDVQHFGDQIAELEAARGAARARATIPDTVGVVAVLDGDGVQELGRGLGAVVIPGRAGALPSVADFLDAIAGLEAERLVLLPGHRNAVATAEKAAELAASDGGRVIDVVRQATTPPAVVAALAVLDLQAPADAVVADLRAAADGVRSGEVVMAVRDATTPIGDVVAGQPLGVVDGKVIHAGRDGLEALRAAAEALDVASAEIVTVMIGADPSPQDRDAATALLAQLTDAEVEVVDAGFLRSWYWIGVE